MFRDDYRRLLDDDAFEALAASSYDCFEYVYGLFDRDGSRADRFSVPASDRDVAYHSHCQQRTLGVHVYTTAVLERLGYDLLTSDVECCGMAGSFGYKRDYYELSLAVGTDLREQFVGDGDGDGTSDADADGPADGTAPGDRTVVASGTSCCEQLDALLGRPVAHPVELLARALSTPR